MRILLSLLLVLLWAVPTQAQVVIGKPGGLLAWDHKTDPAAFSYELIVDGGAPTAITASCTAATGLWTCRAPIPALTGGSHTISIVAKMSVSGTEYKSAPSEPLTVLSVIIEIPTNLRIEQGPETPLTAATKKPPTAKKPGGGQ